MRNQLLGSLLMFSAIWAIPYVQFSDVDTQGLETLRKILLVAIRGFAFLLLFSVFFIGLKVFAAGLKREWTARPDGTRSQG